MSKDKYPNPERSGEWWVWGEDGEVGMGRGWGEDGR